MRAWSAVAEVTTLKRCPVHPNLLVKAVTLPLKGSVLRPHPSRDASKPAGSRKTTEQRFRWSEAGWWAWLDLNQRPHPRWDDDAL
jgi:hypothetical protein